MELAMAIVIGVMFAAGTYLILRPNLIRVVMGFGLYSNAANLSMIACGGYSAANVAPFVNGGTASYMDPLPPDIILTAIVISFAVGALLLTIAYRVYLDHNTDNPEHLPNLDDPPNRTVPNVFHQIAQPNPDAPREGGLGDSDIVSYQQRA